ncbi:hypothetical protein FNV43_RR07124 [Rhamnella rubrinervis]|uniref:peptidylprolyl isomerase n=1 Tax=Rhamnella rubrinervis TaxID=2594499 RepID=A0A8K0HFW4_9ROSA|nr:hypothetical protein FNV43_RR07124 [Rhamnella rubrinervis]
MASTMRMMTIPSQFQKLRIPEQFCVRSCWGHVITFGNATSIRLHNGQQHSLFTSLHMKSDGHLIKPIAAAGSGLEASIEDAEGAAVAMKNAKIIVESQNNHKMQLRVDLSGEETQRVFDQVLTNLARTAPPIPGFRRQKGGKTSKVPKSFLLEMLGEDRVTKFVIQEIVSSTIAQYVKKENLNVKDNKINTTQSAAELKLLFTAGNEFGFNAILELENSQAETPT